MMAKVGDYAMAVEGMNIVGGKEHIASAKMDGIAESGNMGTASGDIAHKEI